MKGSRKMEKAVIYGRGGYYRQHRDKLPSDIEIIAYADSFVESATSATGKLFEGKPVLLPWELHKVDYDKVYICTDYAVGNRIFYTLIENDVAPDKILFLNRIVFPGSWEYVAAEDGGVISSIDGIRIKERYITDFDIIVEIFVKGAYRAILPFSDYIVIDMGMNIGAASLYFAQKPEVSKVYGFEPFPDTYEQAIENFARNEQPIRDKIEAYNIALLDVEGAMRVAVPYEQTGWRNIFSQDKDKEQTEIVCREAGKVIGDILKENHGKNVVLKCDVEGSEFKIFESLEAASCFSRIDAVMMEVHGDSAPLTGMLRKHGYKLFLLGEASGIQMLYAVK